MGRLSGPVVAELQLPSIAHLRDIVKLSRQAAADLDCHARLLAVSAATRAFHIAGGLAAAKTRVLYNGVQLDRFCPRPASGYLHRELGLPPGAQLIGTIGQISLRKGQDVLARAAATLAGKLANVHYLVIGVLWVGQRSRVGRLTNLSVLGLLGLTIFGTLFSIYLTCLEIFVVRAVCTWCLGSAVVTTILMLLVVVPVTGSPSPRIEDV